MRAKGEEYPTNSGRIVHALACVRMAIFCASACERLTGKLTICGPKFVSQKLWVSIPFHFERPLKAGKEILIQQKYRDDSTKTRKSKEIATKPSQLQFPRLAGDRHINS